MGYQKIEAKKKELFEKCEAYDEFVKVADKLNSRLAEVKKAVQAVKKQREETAKMAQQLKTCGVKEFELLRLDLLAAGNDEYPEPVSLDRAEKFIKESKAAIDQEVNVWLDKLAASFPANITAGMSFKNSGFKQVLTVLGPEKVNNPNLKGDAAIWFKVKYMDGKETSISRELLSPKKGWKFVRV
jgi:hypothetical protein